MVANILYYPMLFTGFFLGKGLRIKKQKITNALFFLFTMWVIISTVLFVADNGNVTMRNLMQFLFTIQYFIFIIDYKINLKKFEKWVFRFCILLSSLIIIFFISSGQYKSISMLYTSGRLWAQGYIPGWPNSTPIPLLVGLWLSFRDKKHNIFKIMIIMALIVTSSRVALLGIALILLYSIFKKIKKKFEWTFVIFPIIVVVFIFWNDIIKWIFELLPSLQYRMSIIYDRVDIFNVTMQYFALRPITGFGGNSLDQVIDIYGNVSIYDINWQHTHNWLLDTLLRYGAIGLILFSGFLLSVLFSIKDRDKQFMFFLLLIFGLFQTYMRNFTVLFLMVYLTIDTKDDIENNMIISKRKMDCKSESINGQF